MQEMRTATLQTATTSHKAIDGQSMVYFFKKNRKRQHASSPHRQN